MSNDTKSRYECERMGCIRAQRDELAARLTAAQQQQPAEGEALRDLIGKPVRIEWRRPQDDWPTFTLLAYEPPMVRLQGRDDGEWKHKGDTFWVNAAEIVSIVPDKESTDEA